LTSAGLVGCAGGGAGCEAGALGVAATCSTARHSTNRYEVCVCVRMLRDLGIEQAATIQG
jgi:hypothetical protein